MSVVEGDNAHLIVFTCTIDRPYIKIAEESSLFASEEKIVSLEATEQKLTCQIDANPSATSIYWTLNGTQIVSRT